MKYKIACIDKNCDGAEMIYFYGLSFDSYNLALSFAYGEDNEFTGAFCIITTYKEYERLISEGKADEQSSCQTIH